LFEFLNLQSQVVDAPDAKAAPNRLRVGITFQNVSFSYPGRSSPSLKNFTAFIPAGKIIALVGENGAGKTTALKLVSRFYDPDAGSVELDGIDVRRISLSSLRSAVTFMFQTPGNYHFSARENIALGNLEQAGDSTRVEDAAWNAGAHYIIEKLPKRYDSLLGRWFPGGSDLSGGEWQRIALARAFMHQGQIMLLDEPTSAMDSWSEADWFKRLRRLAKGRTVILVTHRLTIAMRADLIHVMKDGQVVESGNHDQLVVQGGLYSQSWRTQVESSSGECNLEPSSV